jgi:DNA-binding MarR family transcriptional regulator
MSNVVRAEFASSEEKSRRGQKLAHGTWFAGPAQAIGDDRLKARHWRVLAAFCVHADHEGYCWPSQETISDMTGLSRTTVAKAIKELTEFGYLKRGRKQRRKSGRFPGNTYRVIRRKRETKPAHRANP